MDPRDLVKVWDAPDNSRLTPKQWSIRLPIHVAAQINALCALYPRKTKTDIIGDLLATALTQLVEALPAEPRQGPSTATDQPATAAGSLRNRFDNLTCYYLNELAGDQNDQ